MSALTESSHQFDIEGEHGTGEVSIDIFEHGFGGGWRLLIEIDRPFQRRYVRSWRSGFDGLTEEELAERYERLVNRYGTVEV